MRAALMFLFFFLCLMNIFLPLRSMEKNLDQQLDDGSISVTQYIILMQDDIHAVCDLIQKHKADELKSWLDTHKNYLSKNLTIPMSGNNHSISFENCRLIHYAFCYGNYQIVEILMDNGARIDTNHLVRIKNHLIMFTAFGVACVFNNHQIIKPFLQKYGYMDAGSAYTNLFEDCHEPIDALCLASAYGSLDAIKAIREFDDQIIKNNGEQAVHNAYDKKYLGIVNYLLDAGVSVNCIIKGKTLMEKAFENGDSEFIALLKSRGASIDQIPVDNTDNENCVMC